jgi:hypothetical protein
MGFILAKKFLMRNKDIPYIANSQVDDFQKVLGVINQLTTPAFTGQLI